MGKWNRRWIPRRSYNNRKKYQDYDYEEPPPSPPSPHHSQSNPPAIQPNSGSLWEVDFCKSVRVPWKKVITTKKYMYCYDNVVKWDDSAGEEAFHNAKKRYWEKINCLPCESPLPDQDIYIDEIDWNPDIDPGLISELDREYFNPDEAGKGNKMETTVNLGDKEVPGCALVQNSENPDSERNPWESGLAQEVGTVKDTSANWDYAKSVKLKNAGNPWEQSHSAIDESWKKNAWKGGADESWGWGQGPKNNRYFKDANNNTDNPWKRGCPDVGYVGEREQEHTDDRSCGWKQWNTSESKQHYPVNTAKWQSSFANHTGSPWDRGWKECGNNSRDSKWSEFQNKRSDNQDFKETQCGCRKREGSFQHQPRYKSSRFQGDNYLAVHQWQKKKSQKRVNFYA